MPLFQYTARDLAGQLVRETLAFNNETALRQYLRKNDLYVLQVSEQKQARLRLRSQRRVSPGDLIITVRQLRTMMRAGMPLVTGLEVLSEQSTSVPLGAALTEIQRAVGQGRSLGAALGEFPAIFPPLLVALVNSGEEAGRLPEALEEAARQLEFRMEIRQRLVSAAVYPSFTLIATMATVLFMLLFIVPLFAGIYRDLKAPLPAITNALVHTSQFMIRSGWLILLAFAGAGFGLARYGRTPGGALKLDALKLRIPLIGPLIRKSASANLTGSLAGLLESGVPLIQALLTAAGVCGNEVIAAVAREAAASVSTGQRLSEELERSGQIPLMVVRMIGTAEAVGELPQVLREITASYTSEVEYALRRIMVLVEPIMILLVAAVVGFVLLALYYPIFNLGNVILQGA